MTASPRAQAALLAGGAGILFARTIALLAGGARQVLRPWVVALTYVEMTIDALTIGAAIRWWRSRDPDHAHLAFRAGAAATLLHAVRVLVFVLGRTGPWKDVDVRPERRADHDERWTWAQVIAAGALSVLGLVGAGLVWRSRRRGRPLSRT